VKLLSQAKTNRPQQGHEALPTKTSGTAIIGLILARGFSSTLNTDLQRVLASL